LWQDVHSSVFALLNVVPAPLLIAPLPHAVLWRAPPRLCAEVVVVGVTTPVLRSGPIKVCVLSTLAVLLYELTVPSVYTVADPMAALSKPPARSAPAMPL
jgi:hypothetical protein